MSGARRLAKSKVPFTLVAHSRLYSSSDFSVVITCTEVQRCQRVTATTYCGIWVS